VGGCVNSLVTRPTYPIVDPRKQRAPDVDGYEESHFAVAFAPRKSILLEARSFGRRRYPLDRTPSFEDLVNDLANDANRPHTESGKTYTEEYVAHSGVSTHEYMNSVRRFRITARPDGRTPSPAP
jgi:hypothetical protein